MTTKTIPQTSAQRLAEIAEILAVGLMRLVARKSSPISAENGESSLDFSATESAHPTPGRTENIGWLIPCWRNWLP
jgi:hypothetical protein